jgi:hypothetical protein
VISVGSTRLDGHHRNVRVTRRAARVLRTDKWGKAAEKRRPASATIAKKCTERSLPPKSSAVQRRARRRRTRPDRGAIGGLYGALSVCDQIRLRLAADVYSYSRLLGQGEEATLRAFDAHLNLFCSAIAQQHGRFVNSAGDSIVAEFASVVEAWIVLIETEYRQIRLNDENNLPLSVDCFRRSGMSQSASL